MGSFDFLDLDTCALGALRYRLSLTVPGPPCWTGHVERELPSQLQGAPAPTMYIILAKAPAQMKFLCRCLSEFLTCGRNFIILMINKILLF